MKPSLLLLGGSLLLASTAHAQAGLRAGANLTQLLATSADRYIEASNQAKIGYQVGFYYQLPLSKRLALVPEVQYSAERVHVATLDNNYNIPEYFGRTDTRLSLTYLNLPVLVRATLGLVYVEAGPQAGLLLSGHEVGTRTVSFFDRPLSTTAIDHSVTDGLRRFDFGPCVGVGIKLPAGLGVSVRAYQGLVSLTPPADAQQPYPYGGRLRRQTLQASLTYQLKPKS